MRFYWLWDVWMWNLWILGWFLSRFYEIDIAEYSVQKKKICRFWLRHPKFQPTFSANFWAFWPTYPKIGHPLWTFPKDPFSFVILQRLQRFLDFFLTSTTYYRNKSKYSMAPKCGKTYINFGWFNNTAIFVIQKNWFTKV